MLHRSLLVVDAEQVKHHIHDAAQRQHLGMLGPLAGCDE